MQTFDQVWRYEAVRQQELDRQISDDAHANRKALEMGQDLRAQLLWRADELAKNHGTFEAQAKARQVMRMALGLLGALGLLIGVSAGLASLGDSARALNLLWVLGSLLLVPTAALVIWLVLMVSASGSGGWLGHWWQWLVGRLLKTGQSRAVWQGWLRLSANARTERWWLALATHGMWLFIMTGVLIAMIMAFSLRHYTFVWETTWLGEDVFVRVAQFIGWLPERLGFTLPDEQTIRTSGNIALDTSAARMAWASWLVGAVFVFGWLPRLILVATSALMLRQRYKRYELVCDDAYALSIQAKLARLQNQHQVDGPAGAPDHWQRLEGISPAQAQSEAAWLAFETQPEVQTYQTLSAGASQIAAADDRESRQQALTQLQQLLPRRLLLVLDARQTPDRGSVRALLAFGALAVQTRVLLLNASDTRARNTAWQKRLQETGVTTPFEQLSQAADWLAGHDDVSQGNTP